VELTSAPFVWRIHDDGRVTDGGLAVQQVKHCVVDESGRVYLSTPQGLGLVHSQDVLLAATALEEKRWPEKNMLASELASTYGFVKSPQQRVSSIT
jgi:hypothetical protein